MKQLVALFIILFSFNIQAQDLPKNPKAGKCYVRGISENDKKGTWKELDCKFISYQPLKIDNINSGVFSEKDEKRIKEKLLKYLEDGFAIMINSHYDSEASKEDNTKLSIRLGRQLIGYLFSKSDKLRTEQIRINALGNSEPIEQCRNTDNCSKIYSKNTRFEYKIISPLPKPKEGHRWVFKEEIKTWCQVKTNQSE